MPSRWADSEADLAEELRLKVEKEEKRRLKAVKQSEKEQAQRLVKQEERPSKRRRLSAHYDEASASLEQDTQQSTAPSWRPCRGFATFELLNPIDEGAYGFVSRARETTTGDIVAIKKLKIDPLRDGGFPVTALREIQCLGIAKHRHIVELREVVTGESDRDVYLVMDFVEHDLATLQGDMTHPFTQSEVKTLMLQIGSAVEFLHDHWILHRDLKTSNILMNNQGEVKLADFGLARLCGEPGPRNLTRHVVTLWYRPPELLLGATTYGKEVDIWSLGCVLGELLSKSPLLPGKNEIDQLAKILDLYDTLDDEEWLEVMRSSNMKHPRLLKRSSRGTGLEEKFPSLTGPGLDLLSNLLSLSSWKRLSAGDILDHSWFAEQPRPKPTAMFPTFPSKAGMVKRRRNHSPPAPNREDAPKTIDGTDLASLGAIQEPS